MESLLSAAREAALHVLQAAPVPLGIAPDAFFEARHAFVRALAGAIGVGLDSPLLGGAVEAARKAYARPN